MTLVGNRALRRVEAPVGQRSYALPAWRTTRAHGTQPARRAGRTLLVASTGGHLEELYRLRARFDPFLEEVEWATFDTVQARQLLAGEVVHFVPFAKPRDARGVLLDGVEAARLLHGRRFARVVSTGAAVAVPFLGVARSRGVAAHYIESAARSETLSLSGRMVSKMPGVRLYGQYAGWSSARVQFRGSVFDGFAQGAPAQDKALEKVVVSVGTQRDFGFRRALQSLLPVLADVCSPSAEILWQTGATNVSGLPLHGVDVVPRDDMAQAIAEADLVVSHAGVASALMALERGKAPLLLPRRRAHGEHADDHQRLIAADLVRRGLARCADPDDLTVDDLRAAARMTIERLDAPRAFVLQPD